MSEMLTVVRCESCGKETEEHETCWTMAIAWCESCWVEQHVHDGYGS